MSLKNLRISRHLSQEQLARMSGLNVRTIQRIERGNTASIETVKCLASALEIEISALKREVFMKDENASNNNGQAIKKQRVEIHTLLVVGAVFVLFGASAVEAQPILGATFYISAAFCFLVAAVKMLKNNIYTWR